MDVQTLQEISLDPRTLEQLHNEIKQELLELLNKSQLSKIVEKYGVSKEVLKIQYTLDVNPLQSDNTNQDQVAIESFSLPMKPSDETNLGWMNPCPIEGYPDGCWVYC